MLDGHVADDVLAKLLVLDADVALRSQLLQRKCEEIERVLKSVSRLRAQRASASEQAAKQHEKELGQVHETIEQVINRARRIRIEMAGLKDQKDDNDYNEEKDEAERTENGETTPRSLQDILAMAQSIRGAPSVSRTTVATVPAASVVADSEPKSVAVDYPRKWKTLIDQYEEMQGRNRDESFRFLFCRKLSELVSLKRVSGPDFSVKANDRPPQPAARVQVSFPKQVARLVQAYRLLGTYVGSNLSMESESCQKAIATPSMSTVVPTYRRLQHVRGYLSSACDIVQLVTHRSCVDQAKNLQRVLDSETNDLSLRMPHRPVLSPVRAFPSTVAT